MPSLKFWAGFLLTIFFGSILLFLIVTETTVMLWLVPIYVALLLGLPIRYFGERKARDLELKTHKAKPEEIQREDDVLLQSVAFSQSILFVMVNLLSIDIPSKLFLAVLVAVCAATCYVLRALGKIKDNARYRFYSMLALCFVISNTVILLFIVGTSSYLALYISFNLWTFFLFLSFLAAEIIIYGTLTEVLLGIARVVFKRRYGA